MKKKKNTIIILCVKKQNTFIFLHLNQDDDTDLLEKHQVVSVQNMLAESKMLKL